MTGVFGAPLASICVLVAAQPGFALEAPARAVSFRFRYRFRAGEAWRERVLHEVEVRDEKGDVVSSRRTERTESVEVVSVDALGAATVRRRPEPGPEEAFEYVISDRGEIPLPERGEETSGGERALLFVSVVSRFAPVVPTAALSPGDSVSRRIVTALPGEGAFLTAETASLASVEGAPPQAERPGERVKLSLRRRSGGGSRAAFLEAVRVPAHDAWLAVTEPARVRLEVTGSAGEGELVFDTIGGKLVSYRMLETTAIEATLVTEPGGEPVGQTLHWTVTVRFEVERVD